MFSGFSLSHVSQGQITNTNPSTSRKFLVKQKAEMFYFITLGSSALQIFSDCNCQKNLNIKEICFTILTEDKKTGLSDFIYKIRNLV